MRQGILLLKEEKRDFGLNSPKWPENAFFGLFSQIFSEKFGQMWFLFDLQELRKKFNCQKKGRRNFQIRPPPSGKILDPPLPLLIFYCQKTHVRALIVQYQSTHELIFFVLISSKMQLTFFDALLVFFLQIVFQNLK